MSAVLSPPHFSYAEYLAWEETQELRHEYWGGEVFAMSGGTTRHNTIGGNAYIALREQTRGTPCRVYMADVKLRVEQANAGFYPDVFVTCSAADSARAQEQQDALLIVEVLSPGTERADRGSKFESYRLLPSLQAYVLAAQDRPHVEAFVRNAEGRWTLFEADGIDATLQLPTPQQTFTFLLADLYRDVDFSQPDPAQDEAVPRSSSGTSA